MKQIAAAIQNLKKKISYSCRANTKNINCKKESNQQTIATRIAMMNTASNGHVCMCIMHKKLTMTICLFGLLGCSMAHQQPRSPRPSTRVGCSLMSYPRRLCIDQYVHANFDARGFFSHQHVEPSTMLRPQAALELSWTSMPKTIIFIPSFWWRHLKGCDGG